MVGKKYFCWRCGASMPVIALLAPNVEEIEEVCLISQIQYIPWNILSFIQEKVPSFVLRYSKTAETKYYANTCPKCKVIYGDFFLNDSQSSTRTAPNRSFFKGSLRTIGCTLVFLSIVLPWIGTSAAQQEPNNVQSRKVELEVQKLELEINKLTEDRGKLPKRITYSFSNCAVHCVPGSRKNSAAGDDRRSSENPNAEMVTVQQRS